MCWYCDVVSTYNLREKNNTTLRQNSAAKQFKLINVTLIGKSFVVSICLRHLADTSPTVGRLLVCALAETYRPLVGQPSADSRPTDGRQTANRRPQAADRFFRKLLCTVPLKLNLCHPEILCTYMIQYYRVSSILHFFTYQQDSILSCFFNMTPNNLTHVCGQLVSNSMLSLPMPQIVNIDLKALILA